MTKQSQSNQSGRLSQKSHAKSSNGKHHASKGTLIIIGGNERREGGEAILQEIVNQARRKDDGHLLLVTAATHEPEGLAEEYAALFKKLGLTKMQVLDIRTRDQAQLEANVKMVDRAAVIFFTGGDQLRITSQMADTPVYRMMQETYAKGGVIAGTSAGAAAMPETMLASGNGAMTPRGIQDLGLAPGLALLPDVVIDTHFSERGRIGRLLGVVAQNPRNIGIGIDEATAIVVKGGRECRVLGVGGVYILDASGLLYSSLSDRSRGVMSIHGVKLHLLSQNDEFDLLTRTPIPLKSDNIGVQESDEAHQ
jgi:cyanophycinase